jgi:hypothetical protein
MVLQPAERAAEVLQVLADLAPSGEAQPAAQVIPLDWFQWLPTSAVSLFSGSPGTGSFGGDLMRGLAVAPDDVAVQVERKFGERLAAIDQIRANEHSLRVGWLFVAGRVDGDDGKQHRVFHPLVTVPVRVQVTVSYGAARLVPAGDVSLTPRVTDPEWRKALYGQMEFGGGALSDGDRPDAPAALLARLERLKKFAFEAAEAAGLPARSLVPGGEDPELAMRRLGTAVLAGLAVYAVHETGGVSRAASLRTWATRNLEVHTAFHSVYVGDAVASTHPVEAPLPSPYVLTPAQQKVVESARVNAITVVSGAPGTGKSHTIVAVATDAIARGLTVLVAAKSAAAVDALLDLLERAPGPDPVVFGSMERRQQLAAHLAAGQMAAVGTDTIRRDHEKLEASIARRDEVRSTVARLLRLEQLLADPSEADASREIAPGLFASAATIKPASSLLDAYRDVAPGVFGAWRRWRAWRKLTRLAECDPRTSVPDLEEALETARLATTIAGASISIAARQWRDLADREAEVRAGAGVLVASVTRSEKRWNRRSLGAVAAVATALRSGRAARREQLARLTGDDLTRALPLWIGTLPDIDDLLPPVAGLFDLVILDEASAIDQSLAATALLRGRAGVVAGDPRQLRHVSFLSDEELAAAVEAHDLADDPQLAARLDARRNSTLDVAMSVAPVIGLEEHFRSAPHLIQFAADRLYSGNLRIATRSPINEALDCIDVARVHGDRNKDGVVEAEVLHVIRELRRLHAAGARSVGVVTPFRAQADALEAAALESLSLDQIKTMDLRIGTVHAFQGNERDEVLISVGVGADDRSWRFVEDPHLCAVMITRARRHTKLFISTDPPDKGLIAGYLDQADQPYRHVEAVDVTAWTNDVASDLRLAGVRVEVGYRVGRHVVDVCVFDQPTPVAINCGVHEGGIEDHISRHLDLLRGGWHIHEAFPGRWRDQRGELVIELLQSLRRLPTS